ncbi:MAG TPA: hypothetical protein VKC65_06140 [Gaiellaceae bacterium]|nr:hypothetical protein [Gaiellaceae bacterium]
MASAAQAPATPTRAEPEPLTRRRAIAVWTLLVVASILILISSLTIWVRRQALDTDAWTNASGKMLANDEIRQQLSIYLVDTLFQSADASARIQQALPANRAGLAPVISGALQNVAIQAADRILETPQAQALWEEANRRAHQNLIAVLEGKDVRRFQTAEGEVVLDLSPLVQRLSDRFGFQASPDAGKITILHSGQLKNAQRALKAIKVLSVFLLVLVLFLYGLAIYLAHGHRRRILRATAASFVLVGVLALVIQRITGGVVIDSLIKTDAIRPAGNAAWNIGTELLRNVAYALILYGVAGLFGAWLAGPTRWAVSARQRLAPVFEDQAWIVYGVVTLLFLLVLAWGPTQATREWWGILLLGGLLFFGVAMLHRQTVREFPAAKTPAAPA